VVEADAKMPETIHAKVIIEHRLAYHDHREPVRLDLTCMRSLLDDVRALHKADFEGAFGPVTVQALLEDWQNRGLDNASVTKWSAELRQAAFSADSLGETSMEFRNKHDLPDIAPGAVPVLCAILDYLAGSCGFDGAVQFVVGDGES
jgi:hypothetical protein